MPWFKFYPERWFFETINLNANEARAYLAIQCELFQKSGFAKLNIKVLARRCQMRPTSFGKAVDALVNAELIELEDGFVTCKAVTDEIESREKLRRISMKSEQKRHKNPNEINATNPECAADKEEREKKIESPSYFSELSPALCRTIFSKQSSARLAARKKHFG